MGNKRPRPATHPHLFAWAAIVNKFSDSATAKWPATGELPRAAPQTTQQPKDSSTEKPNKKSKKKDSSSSSDSDSSDNKGKKKSKKSKKDKNDKKDKKDKKEKKETKKADEDDDFDPFAEDAEADAAAAEAMKKKAEEAKSGKKKKAAPVAKSLIIWEVKPWGEDTDLDALAQKILAIQMDGLFWKTEWKREPVAYGIYKIVIGATVEDEKVSTDLVQERIEAIEDDVQSVDIVAFNKL